MRSMWHTMPCREGGYFGHLANQVGGIRRENQEEASSACLLAAL